MSEGRIRPCAPLFLTAFLLAPFVAAANPSTIRAAPDSAGRIFHVGVPADMPPIAFPSRNQREVRGLAVDLAVMIGKCMRAKVHLHSGSRAELEAMLRNGTVSFLCGLPRNRADAKAYALLDTGIMVERRLYAARDNLAITCEQDYPGRRIAFLRGDDYGLVVEGSPGAIPVPVGTHLEGVQFLFADKADVFVAQSSEAVEYFVQQYKLTGLKRLGVTLEKVPLVILADKGDQSLLAALEAAFTQMEGGRGLSQLKDKWLGYQLLSRSLWQVHGRTILYAAAGPAAILLGILAWNFALTRQVARVTGDLRLSEQKYRELIEASPDMILLLSPQGEINLANRIARQTLGIDRTGGGNLLDALNPAEAEELRQVLAHAGEKGYAKRQIGLSRLEYGHGEFEFIAFPTAEGGAPQSLVCLIARDMTERSRMEAELIQVERQAVIGKLAAGVAHEINNPLGIIMANAEAMMPESGAPGQHIEAIRRNVERAAKITNRLLHLAVPSELSLAPLNLSEMVRENLAYLKPSMAGVACSIDLPEEPLNINGDKSSLEQVIVNLILNAINSMAGEGRLTVRGRRRSGPPRAMVRLEIMDTGKGIAPEHLEAIFDIFFTSRPNKGFGLGLFVARRIVEKHGGALFATSEEGCGARLVMDLPALTERIPD